MSLTLKNQVQKILKFLIGVPHLQNHKFQKNQVLSTRLRHVSHPKTSSQKQIDFCNKDKACTSP